jgi:hypothetical protein
LQDPRAIERAAGDGFRASLDEKVRGRESPTVEPDARSETPDRTDPVDAEKSENRDAPDSNTAESRDASDASSNHDDTDVVHDDEAAPPGDDAGSVGDEDGQAVVVAGVAGVALAVDGDARASAAAAATESQSTAVNANTNGSTSGAAAKQGAQAQQFGVGPAQTIAQDGAAEDGADLTGDQSLNGKLKGLDVAGANNADESDARETSRFADRLAARIGEQTASAQAADARTAEGANRPIEASGQTNTAGLKTTQAAPAKADPGAVQAERVDDRASVASVNRGMAAVVKQNGGSVTIKLSPESLGPLKIQMTIDGGRVDLRFDAATDQARDMLTRNADMLRQSLHNKGLGVERMQVHTAPASTESADGRGAQQRQDGQDQQHRQDASREQSRGYSDRRNGGGQGEQQGWRERPETFSSAWRVALNATA